MSMPYDVNNRLLGMTTMQQAGNQAPLTIASFAYTLDAEGERTQVAEADGTLRKYGYDSIARLTSETVAGALSYAKTFTYDAVGNRKTQVTTGTGAASDAYVYDSRDRLSSETGVTYTYDTNGNELTKSGEATYTW